jgi:exonuclease III
LGVGLTTQPCKKSKVTNPTRERTGLILKSRPGERFKELRIGTWNVRTLYQPGALKKLIEQINKYRCDVTALQEIRWTGSGIMERRDCTMLYSCHSKDHMFGTGFIVHNRAKHLILDFKPINPKIATLRLKGRFFNYTLINCHAPTEDKSDDEKDEFYDTLTDTYDKCEVTNQVFLFKLI